MQFSLSQCTSNRWAQYLNCHCSSLWLTSAFNGSKVASGLIEVSGIIVAIKTCVGSGFILNSSHVLHGSPITVHKVQTRLVYSCCASGGGDQNLMMVWKIHYTLCYLLGAACSLKGCLRRKLKKH